MGMNMKWLWGNGWGRGDHPLPSLTATKCSHKLPDPVWILKLLTKTEQAADISAGADVSAL
jgi:hypothetical protein